jgi:mxaD protein
VRSVSECAPLVNRFPLRSQKGNIPFSFGKNTLHYFGKAFDNGPFHYGHCIMKRLFVILLGIMLFPLTAKAHGPTPQKGLENITINAPVDKIWDAVKEFDAIADWHPDVKESSGDGRHESGGIRTLTFHNGGQITEELDYYSDKDHEYSYRLKKENVEAFPTSSYAMEIQVKPGEAEGTSVVTLKSRFYRGDTGNTPPEKLNDEAAVKAVTAFLKNGLDGLKTKLEK